MTAAVRVTRAATETARLGEVFAPALEPGDVIALTGELGAGKTCFVAGLARGLDCRARVRSPSFALVNEYHGRLLLLHLDLYRLDTRDFDGLGLDEYRERGVLVVEWGERLPAADRAEALTLAFETPEGDTRVITGTATGGRGLALLAAWTRTPSESDRIGKTA